MFNVKNPNTDAPDLFCVYKYEEQRMDLKVAKRYTNAKPRMIFATGEILVYWDAQRQSIIYITGTAAGFKLRYLVILKICNNLSVLLVK
jgi:hypothetical protein